MAHYVLATEEQKEFGEGVRQIVDKMLKPRITYGTDRANAYRILEDSLNLRDVRIYDTIGDADGKEKRVLNARETTLAAQKQQALRDAFNLLFREDLTAISRRLSESVWNGAGHKRRMEALRVYTGRDKSF